MIKFKKFLKNIFFQSKYGLKFWQISKALFLLREKSFRKLFLEVNKGDICLDLGANRGYTSLIMWLRGAKFIYSLEPNIKAFELLRVNLKGIKNISILDLAISSKTEKQNLYLHKSVKNISDFDKILEFSQASSLMANKTNIGSCFYEVQAITLEDLYSKLPNKPSIIKCDIEGGEYMIYEQFVNLARNKEVKKIFVECHANKYPQYKEIHDSFIKLIRENNLSKIIDTTWH